MDFASAIVALKQDLKKDPSLLDLEKQVIDKYGKMLSYNNIDNLTAEQFQSFCDFQNNHHWTISRHKTNLTKDMPKLKKSLKILLDEKIPLEQRLRRLRDLSSPDYQKYLGEAYFTPILLVTNPTQYPVYNGTVKKALGKMQYMINYLEEPIWKEYPKVREKILELAKSTGLSLWQIDWVWWNMLGSMIFDDLKYFIEQKMVMQENYQPIVIAKLVDAGGIATKDEIRNALDQHNQRLSESALNTVLNVLESHDVIRIDEDEVILNTTNALNPNEAKQIIELCNQKIIELENRHSDFNCWIWAVDKDNWEIAKEKKIWASKAGANIRQRIKSNDKAIFYVIGTNAFQGIFEFTGDWYDAPAPVWADEKDSIIYQSQIRIKPIKIGHLDIYDTASKLKLFASARDKRDISLLLKGAHGHPSNNSKPIPYEDYLTISNAMGSQELEPIRYWKIAPGAQAEYWQNQLGNGIIAIGWKNLGNLSGISQQVLNERMRHEYPKEVAHRSQIENFLKIKKGDIIIANKGKSKVVGIGRVISDYKYYQALEYPHVYQVDWFDTKERDIPTQSDWYITVVPVSKEMYEQILGTVEIQDDEQIPTFTDDPLTIPTKDELKEGYAKISEELLIPEEKIIEIVTALASGRHILLAGPIGTGKTQLAKRIPEIFWEKYGGYYSEDHTATSDWSTQDVIGGIFPKMGEDGNPIYEIQNGCVTETVQKNWVNGKDGGKRRASKLPVKNPPYRGTWLIIDEFNRADIDKAFGQLFTTLRTRTLKIPTDTKGESYKTLQIPEDYRIIGTLNTADKHFLFQLSDALKSRFAYIEIDIPKREEMEQEIYYAMKNAISELKNGDYADLVTLDHQKKVIEKEKSSPEFYNRVYQAYHFLDLIRVFKKLGTAILKLIYQNLLVGTKITGDSRVALDNALATNLTPQMENVSQAAIGAIDTLYSGNIVTFFKTAYKSPNQQSYSVVFSKVMSYLQLSNAQKLSTEFLEGTLQVDNDSMWTPIQTRHENKKNDFESELNQLKQSMTALAKSTVT